jgi:hypothetical protein
MHDAVNILSALPLPTCLFTNRSSLFLGDNDAMVARWGYEQRCRLNENNVSSNSKKQKRDTCRLTTIYESVIY